MSCLNLGRSKNFNGQQAFVITYIAYPYLYIHMHVYDIMKGKNSKPRGKLKTF